VHKRGVPAILSLVLALAVAACDVFGGGGGDGRAGDTDGAAYLLQAWVIEEVEPEDQFGRLPAVTITADHVVVTHGPVPAVFPGPLLPNLRGRTITAAGYGRIVSEAERLGLLDSDRAARPAPPPGGQRGEILLWVDGEFRTIEGDLGAGIQCIRAPCDAAPGTAEAFGAFWAGILDLGTALPDELGPDQAYTAPAFSLLIGVPPNDPAGLAPNILQWPLDVPLAQAGGPAGDEPMPRCWTVRDEDAGLLAPLLAAANQLTEWTDETGEEPVVIWVHPILVGGDPCMDSFGVMPVPS
jgi:hypothetical protein